MGNWKPMQYVVVGGDHDVIYTDSENNDYLPGEYKTYSDGTIRTNSGEVIGTTESYNNYKKAGYNNIFDYNAAKAGYNSREAVKQLQKQLGLKADGLWGRQTEEAYKAYKQMESLADIKSLYNITQDVLSSQHDLTGDKQHRNDPVEPLQLYGIPFQYSDFQLLNGETYTPSVGPKGNLKPFGR